MKVLLIEGNLESAELTRKVLAQHGYELAIATSAVEALTQLADHSPSMLLLRYRFSSLLTSLLFVSLSNSCQT